MNIEEQWKHMEEQWDDDLGSLLKMRVMNKLVSKDPLQKIKSNLLIHCLWAILISVMYIFILVYFPLWQIVSCIGIVFLFTIWAVVVSLKLYRRLSANNPSLSVVEQMEYYYQAISKWMNIQQWAGLVIYPISAAGGFMLGGFVGSGKSIEVFMQKPVVIAALLICIAVLVPCCFYLTRWMTKKAFGRYADSLKQNIDAFKKEN